MNPTDEARVMAKRRQAVADFLTGNGYTSDEAFDVAKGIIAADPATPRLAELEGLLAEAKGNIETLVGALESTIGEAQAWRDGLNTRAGMKNMNNARVGCRFIAFGLDGNRRKASAARSFLQRLGGEHE